MTDLELEDVKDSGVSRRKYESGKGRSVDEDEVSFVKKNHNKQTNKQTLSPPWIGPKNGPYNVLRPQTLR